jgi:hypothetical protein
MAYDENTADRLRGIFAGRPDVVEKKMFGGIAFMLNGNMCCGVIQDMLMARVGPAHYAGALQQPHARDMDFTGRPMKGFVFVEAAGIETDMQLLEWVDRCQAFVATLPPK